jgi:hypothetical protein
LQAYLRDLWQQASVLHEQKRSADDAAARIDMTRHKPHYATIPDRPGIAVTTTARLYELIEGRAH